MSDAPSPLPARDVAALLLRLGGIEARIASEVDITQAKLSELRRQAKARPRRRGGAGSADTRKYAIGGAVVMLAGEIDATTFLGLLGQTDMLLKWMAEARLAHGPLGFGALVAAILADPRKADWCRRWGAIFEWHHRKALYDAGVANFEASGRTGLGELWRRDEFTDEQALLVQTLCTLLGLTDPDVPNKGAAYEWIKQHGGNPEYWAPPSHPDDWSDDHAN